MNRPTAFLAAVFLAAGWMACLATPSGAGSFELDPARSELRFALPATLHTVRGSFRFLAGRLALRAGDEAVGEFVVDASSGETGNASRDRTMHGRVLESARFPRFVLRVRAVELGPDRRRGRLRGTLEVQGSAHPLEITFSTEDGESGRLRARGSFAIPYVEWGLHDVSNLLLRVDPVVEVEFSVEGTIDD